MRVLLAWLLLAPLAAAPPVELGQGWLPEFNLAARQITELARAIPADKYAWRPAPGVRSISEVYMHIALGNLGLLQQAEAKVNLTLPVPKNPEISVKEKNQVIEWLEQSFAAVRGSYPPADPHKKVAFLGQQATVEGVFLRILVHNHEHMGQSVAYARMIGVTPPWSAKR